MYETILDTDTYPIVPIPNIWTNTPYPKSDVNKVKKFLPDLKFSYTGKSNLAIRVFLSKWKKNDSRVPQIIVPKKNYYQILSTKVDHAVTISDKLVKMLSN